ncbi:tail fiber assembly protein [Budviciaceae bacterium BWR-B9]|uniref:Tail fiber assembly protein n=1 Tax=Limnobaculum allomyrinae TaxID=2791986 RepID=A0ABS1INQ7_9GAMM|nr:MULTISPECIES: tail fiber assembly protein [Limnobaculum]MBK5143391.1 tail fiber assembly protein [Limnobaculum allomyrinae]MBV7691279.1 tail fiber assembly protein [Limnobaculum sp. M2-1]
MKYFYSISENAFFPTKLKSAYLLAGTWPSDLIEIPIDIFNEYSSQPPNGKIRKAGDNGSPCWVDIPPLPHNEQIIQINIQKSRLLDKANYLISNKNWHSKVVLGRISNEEKQEFNKWLNYIDAVNAIDTSTTFDIKWPTPPSVD